MKVGLQIPSFKYNQGTERIAPILEEIVTTADKGGFSSLWVMDHYFQMEFMQNGATDPMLEGYSTLNYFAGLTNDVTLGTLVTGVIYRYPGFLIKTATTLDVLSEGRAYLGIGAAWYEREAKALGIPFPSLSDRFEMLEETLQIAKQMWDQNNNGPYDGKHYELEETLCIPQPIQEPHPPILIGGMGEKKTLRFAAKYADACNLFAREGIDTLEHKLSVLKKHCDDVGRDFDEIEKTTLGTVNLAKGEMTPDEVIKHFKELSEIGIDHAIVNMPENAHEITPIEIFKDAIIPAVVDL